MPRPGSAASRGYGHAHRRQAAWLKARMHDGDPCCRCGLPMYRGQALEADHHQVPMAMGGVLPDALAHASCNRRAGAILGNRLRGARRRGAQRQAEIVGRVPTRRATGTPSRAW